MIAATLAGSWRVSGGFAEKTVRHEEIWGRRREGRGRCAFCHDGSKQLVLSRLLCCSQRCELKGIPCFAEQYTKRLKSMGR